MHGEGEGREVQERAMSEEGREQKTAVCANLPGRFASGSLSFLGCFCILCFALLTLRCISLDKREY